jgi:predicted ATPase/DNA-binding SARP family transcriptional activator
MLPRLCLFGPPTLHVGGESFALPPERRSQLLVLLALKRTWVGRAELAAMLWPQLPQKLAFGNLRKTLFRLQPLPGGGAVELQGGTLRFEAQTDVFEFDRAWRERDFRAAVALRPAELLQGFDDDENEAWSSWLAVERERLRVAWREAALQVLGAGLEPAEGVPLSRRLLELDPLDEAALRCHMQCLAQSGQPAQARLAYRAFAAQLQQELGVAPGVQLKALHDALGAPAPRAALPGPAGAGEEDFIGRALELRQLREMLTRPPCRLLTLVGPGGVGKSRLARRALRELAPQFADGAEFVALEDVVSPSEVIGRVAHELGLRLAGGRDALAVVSEHLRARELLLVLDNFEHVVPALAIVERLAQACPRLKLLVTSRVRLGHAMEWVLPLGGLPCPDPADLDRLEAFDAAQLFIQASRRVEPALAVAAEAAAIAEICRLVEGLPLALELAATWTRVLSCEAIATALSEGTALLGGGDAGAHPPRHASFERVFEQTWRLLGESERAALARLSVFSGGFTAEAARAVAGVAPALLGGLADQSLLRKEGPRLSMHPLVQRLAAQRLEGIEAAPATRSAHASYYLRWLTQLRRPVEDGQREAMEWVDTECDNCRAALHWSITHEEVAAAARSVATLTHFCDHRARIDEGLEFLRAILDSQGAAGEPGLTALLLGATAQLQYRLDRYDEALASASRAIAEGGTAPDGEARLQALQVLGACHLRLGRLDEAERCFRQALQDAPAGADPRHAAAMTDHLARVARGLGRRAEARRLAMRSLLQHRRLGDVAGEALCLGHLGELMLDGGDAAAAEVHLQEGLAICERHGLVSTRGLILSHLAETALRRDDAGAAEGHARQALEIAEAAGNRALAAGLRLQCFRLALRRGALAGARAELAAAADAALALGRAALQLQVAAGFAELLAQQQEPQCARAVQAIVAGPPAAGAEAGTSPAQPWPEIGLDELLHRIALEAGLAHAPLIAALRAA